MKAYGSRAWNKRVPSRWIRRSSHHARSHFGDWRGLCRSSASPTESSFLVARETAPMFHANDQIGPYTLVCELGRGGFGVVWLAERRAKLATTRVALKFPFLSDPDLDAIRQEALLWVQASGHPNVLPVIEAEVYEGQIVIVSEYASEGSVAHWLRRHGHKAPSFRAAADIACGILSGLSHLHSRSILHRDLKPQNILLQGENPRIADFGIARVMNPAVQTLNIAGTPPYMAPEAWHGERSQATDLWAVGVILYEMLAGYRPFPESDIRGLSRAIAEDEPKVLPPGVPEQLAVVVGRALQKDPRRRYQSAEQMLGDLRSVRTEPITPPVLATTVPMPSAYSQILREIVRPAFTGAATLGALGMVLGYGAGANWMSSTTFDSLPLLAGDPLLASVEQASTGIVGFVSLLLAIAVMIYGLIVYWRSRKQRRLVDKLFNISKNFKEMINLYKWILFGVAGYFCGSIVLKAMVLLLAFPASLFVSAPLSPAQGVGAIGLSGAAVGSLLGSIAGAARRHRWGSTKIDLRSILGPFTR